MLLHFLTCLIVVTNLSAQNLDHFTALTGAQIARDSVAKMGLTNASLIAISNYLYEDSTWCYLFSYDSNKRLISLSVKNENSTFTMRIIKQILTKDFEYSANELGFRSMYPNVFHDLPLNSIITDSNFSPKFDLSHHYYSILSSRQNLYCPWYDTTCSFDWYMVFGHGEGCFSACTGQLLSFTDDVQESSTSFSSLPSISPNPTTGSISIKGTTTSPQIPILVRIIDALGIQHHQEYTQAIADGTFTFLWDGVAGGESLPTGAYSALMTVGSVVKSVPFVVVR